MQPSSNVIITTTHSSRKSDPVLQEFIEDTGWRFVNRERRAIALLREVYEVDNIVVWDNGSPILYAGDEEVFFHPSMAKNRLTFYRKTGQTDMMMKAIDISKGESYLDCTFGLGSDAIVASYFSGTGRITGLESSPILAGVVSWGMKTYHSRMAWLDEAVHNIELFHYDHLDFLVRQEDSSYDIVYFDPMFREPMMKSASMNTWRSLTDARALSLDTIAEGIRVARRRVVIKERLDSGELERLGSKHILQNKNNPIGYGIIDK